VGFAVVMLSSCVLEAMRMKGLAPQGFAPGGALGAVLAPFLAKALGFTGATLLLLALLAGGVSLFTGLSWLRFAELFGAGLEWTFSLARARVEARRDREEGRIKAQE